MANLQERRDKSGKLISYSIRVHRGRGADGKQLKPWTATFEKECREGVTSDSRLRFEEYCNYVIGLKEQRGIKHSTIVRYRELTERLYPLPLGSAFGSGKSSGRKQQLMQTKRPETVRFRVFLARREGFEPPAFWSVGCLKGKTEPFRLRFVLFTAARSADFPLFPSSPARSNPILGQNWVKDRCMAGEFEQSVRIHAERLIGQQLFLPEGLCINDLIVWKCLGQNLQH